MVVGTWWHVRLGSTTCCCVWDEKSYYLQSSSVFSFYLLFAMTSEGSSASASGSSSPSTTDLKGLIKDSLRELLHDEPALLRGAVGSVKGESHGGKFAVRFHAGFYCRRTFSPLAPVVGHVAGAASGCLLWIYVWWRALPPWRLWTATWLGWGLTGVSGYLSE